MPITDTDRSHATDKWRSAAVNRPESRLIGVMYAADPVDADIVVKVAQHRVFADNGLTVGSTLPGLLDYEGDCVQIGTPANMLILAESPWTVLTDNNRLGLAHMSIYTRVVAQ